MTASGKDDNSPNPATTSSVFLSPQAKQDQPVLHHPDPEARLERQRRIDIRKALIQQARDKFGTLAEQGDTAYSQQLHALEEGVNGYLSTSGYKAYDGRQAIVLDPDEFGVGRALGIDAKETVRRLLESRGVEAPKDAVADIAAGMGQNYESKFGVVTKTQDAGVRNFTDQNGGKPFVLAPASDNIGPNRVPGMAYGDNTEFINRHESWHIKDRWYDLSGLNRETVTTVRAGFASNYIAGSDDAAQAYSIVSRKEALADVAALGDMMRDRNVNNYKLLNQVAAWRDATVEDDTHTSAPVLKGMKQEIDRMGFGKFMKMDEEQVHDFYHQVVEKYGMSPQAVAYAANYEEASKEDRKKLIADAGNDPDMKKALDFLAKQKTRASPDENFRHEDDIQRKIDAYDPKQALIDKAFEIGRKITPETLIHAHRDMAGDLLKQATDEDARCKRLGVLPNPLYRLEMAKLKEAFVNTVQTTDYVEANKKKGVDIEDAEPFLRDLPPTVVKGAAPDDGGIATQRIKKPGSKPTLG